MRELVYVHTCTYIRICYTKYLNLQSVWGKHLEGMHEPNVIVVSIKETLVCEI